MTGCNGFFNVTNKKSKVYFAKTFIDKGGFIHVTIPLGAFEIENLNDESRKNIIEESQFTEVDCHFTDKPNFSTLNGIIEISRQEPWISFTLDASNTRSSGI